MQIKDIIKQASDEKLAEHITETFKEVEKNFQLKSWKTSSLDAGHFVEAIRRFLELKLFGQYTPINKPLPNFNEKCLNSYLNKQGEDSYRIHIPRLLFTIYGIRNKRGIGHISNIKPNKIDASLILTSCKWVLAEIIRLNSQLPIEETEILIDEVIDRNIEGIWEVGETVRILEDGLTLKDKILYLLYNKKSLKDTDIQSITEYSNITYLKKTLREFHKKRLIEYKEDGECILSPKGAIEAEKIVLKK
ncbi:MAG: hypothetical protein Crog4KO_16540 [Crocinitomicaceae bacterium]